MARFNKKRFAALSYDARFMTLGDCLRGERAAPALCLCLRSDHSQVVACMRTAILSFLLVTITAGVAPRLVAAPLQNAPVRAIGTASRRLTSTDLDVISRLAGSRGQPWLAIANWPQRDGARAWLWTVHVYLSPDSDTGTLRRGPVAVVTSQLPAPDAFSIRKDWQLSASALAYAEVPVPGRSSLTVGSERDPRRPFIAKASDTFGQISDADLLAVVALLRSGPHGAWAISEVALMDPNLVTVETIDPNPSQNSGESAIVHRDGGRWTVTQTMERRLPSPVQSSLSAPGTAPPGSAIPAVVVVILAAGLNAFGFWAVFSAWRGGRGSPQFILGLLPLALMFLVAPVPVIIWQMIRDFQHFAPQGGSAASMLAICERQFLAGGFGFLLSIAAAAALQWHAGWVDPAPADDGTTATRSTRWQTLALALSSVIALPVLTLGALVERLPRTIVERALAAMQPASAPPPDLEHLSAMIAGWLILAFAGGIVGVVVVALMGVMTLILVRSNRFSGRITTYAWIVVAIVALFGMWNVSRIATDLNWLASAAARPPR
jgi:hypothetical protein